MAEMNGGGVMSARARKLKERLLASDYEIDIERARCYTQAWKDDDGVHPCIRAALALKKTLREMTIRIDDDELLAGVKTSKQLAGVIPVERGEFNSILDVELDRLTSRDRHPFLIGEPEHRELEGEILPYWRGRTVRDIKIRLWEEEGILDKPSLRPASIIRILRQFGLRNALKIGYLTTGRSLKYAAKLPRLQKELMGIRPNLALTVFDVQGHFVPGYKRVLEMGFKGIAQRAMRGLEELDPKEAEFDHKRDFLSSVVIVSGAVRDLSYRYAKLARETARTEESPRREELLLMAERLGRVPYETPRNFMEALQSVWMTQVANSISYGMAEVLSPGRVDQYLYPYYKSDVESGLITSEQAREALEEYLVKLGTYLIMLVEVGKDTASELGVGSNTITVGGSDRKGEDATNELSYLFLEANDNVRGLANNMSVRVSPKSPREFLLRACESYRSTSGLAFFNDEVIVRELVDDGYSLQDACDYSIVGCVEPTSTGNSFACTAGNDISLAGVLEMTLNEGRMLFMGKRVGEQTPHPRQFESFDDVKAAFTKQLSFNVTKLVRSVELLDRAYRECCPSPLLSCSLEGCLESGKDITLGGARYNYGSITGRGLGTVADSLAAIKWAVFDENLLSMEKLHRLLKTNFRRSEKVRQELLRRAPKYGNDNREADAMASWVARVFANEVRRHSCRRGGFYRPGIFSYGVHVVDGLYLGATPDGRLAGEPVSNGISPVNGSERRGPTAVLHSAAAAACPPLSNGTALNMRLSPALFETRESIDKLASLIRGYFDLGGRNVQFNVVDNEILRDAQAHPEKYPDLVVRVSGYCAYFTDLGKSIQDDIIARTNFGALSERNHQNV